MRFYLLSLLLLASPALGQTADSAGRPSATRTLRAAERSADIQIDGRLDEAAWQGAEAGTGFTQSYPNPGAEPTQRTETRVLYDDAALYVGVRMYDSAPDSIAAQLARRDAFGIYSDWVHVIIDSYHDRRSGFRFSVNPRGVQKDVYHFDDGNEDLDWDAVWQVGTQVDSLGWTAEYRIPLSQIRFNAAEPTGGRVWGFQVQRDIARREERDSWSPWTREDAGYVSRFGDLAGLQGIRPVRRVELLPYVSSRLTRAPGEEANPFYQPTEGGFNAGADVKLGLTSGLTLTGTINPDFGQVEVDPAVVNLSAFETFFPEKRPFFVEGADIFNFGQIRSNNNYQFEEYFYSRRVGRSPQRSLQGNEVLYSDAPDQSTILGAAKVSGKAGPWTIGVMDAVTAEERGQLLERYVGAGGDTLFRERAAAVEPLSNYFVGRVRREMRGGSTVIGGMVNTTHRDMGDTLFTSLLRSRALFGGVDFEHTWSQRRWALTGYLAGSHVSGSEGVIEATQRSSARYFQRPDAEYVEVDPTRTSLGGTMAEVALSRNGNYDLSIDFKQTSPGFEINDLGFQPRVDYRSVSTFLGRRVTRPGRTFRNFSQYVFSNYAWNWGGDQTFHGYGMGVNGTFNNFWSAGAGLNYNPASLNDRLTRGGPLAQRPREWRGYAEVSSDSRKPISFGGGVSYEENTSGANERAVGLEVAFRPSTTVRLSLRPEMSWELDTDQYVRAVTDPLATETFGTRYVFADVDQKRISMTTRLDWTFSPNLSLQLFAQPFVASGDFQNYKEFLTPGDFDFSVYDKDRGTIAFDEQSGRHTVDPDAAGPAAPFTFGERDFNFRSLRGNAVLRWEYRPGSALFFVWQQQRDGTEAVGTFDFGRDAGELFRAPATNVFLIKATYWIGR